MEAWFSKLRDYFPAREMKTESHMKRLFSDKKEYQLDEGPDHTLVYYEKPDYLFIDYVLVNESARGSGLGSKLLGQVKERNKLILVEVDPVTPDDPETEKRVRFYERQGFQKASSIRYARNHPVTGEQSVMDIFYWAPNDVSLEFVLEKMREAYEEVHAHGSIDIYGTKPEPSDSVLKIMQHDRSH